ncbi:hypothetical protein DCAR_0101482 [Daucus carota subsp. sativus]|uniref:Uncharacterized protein n=1 Tax=Daucus carota subsp. sativus TaxID=79200 RepID=A0A166GEW0_DAUCS|nr:hypothetical protein DCAR_0101482 [Daucus carota subsp. sativus]
MKMRKAAEAKKVNVALRKSMVKKGDDESGATYLSDEMRSVASSSEDEIVRRQAMKEDNKHLQKLREPSPTTQAKATDSSYVPITAAAFSKEGETDKSHCLTRSEGKKFMKDLRGPLYNEWLLKWPPINRPGEATIIGATFSQSSIKNSHAKKEEEKAKLPLDEEDYLEEDELEEQSTQPIKSVRMITKTQFKFKNTPETAVDVDEDNDP